MKTYPQTQTAILNWLINDSGYTSKDLQKIPQAVVYFEYVKATNDQLSQIVFGRVMGLLGFTRKSIRLPDNTIAKSWQKTKDAIKRCPDCSICSTCNNTGFVPDNNINY